MKAFNSYDAVKKLTDRGVPEDQASEIINAIMVSKEHSSTNDTANNQGTKVEQELALIRKDIEILRSEIATKSELSEIKTELVEINSELKQDIANTRVEIKQEINDSVNELKQEIASTKAEIKQGIIDSTNQLKQDISSAKQEAFEAKLEIKEIKRDFLKWIIPFFIAFAVVIIVKNFPI
ncbi:coiled-coil domain-containing protein [Candidatus Jidaibacter acanthamoebae]|nr:coiled-coil domain-containing protein [Candidatus Jidaibacter acanthamoeba]